MAQEALNILDPKRVLGRIPTEGQEAVTPVHLDLVGADRVLPARMVPARSSNTGNAAAARAKVGAAAGGRDRAMVG
jgi:hypothetical protein